MRRLEITRAFARDLDLAFIYIAERNFEAARRFRSLVEAAILDAQRMPTMAPERPDLPAGLRSMRVQSHALIYRFDNESITFLRLAHVARDFTQFF